MEKHITHRNFNQLKKSILELLKSGNVSTSSEIVEEIDANLTNISDCLLRLRRLRLVDRRQIETELPGRPHYTYTINSRGLDRLTYWKQQEEEATL